jgi:polysaccharide export outer membrane protein
MMRLFLLALVALGFAPGMLNAQEVRKAVPVARAQAAPRAEAVAMPAASFTPPGSATLRPGDLFTMRLSGMPAEFASEFSVEYTVGTDGNVNIPLVGDVRAEGHSAGQLEKAIQQRLVGGKIFSNPTVIINIQQVARIVTVGGGVRQPQRMQWFPDLTLKSAIQSAGGLNEFASGKGIRIIRVGKVFGTYDWKKISRDPSLDPKLLPGDQVDVPE